MEKKKIHTNKNPLRSSADILLVDVQLYACGQIMEEIKLFISGLGGITQLVEYLPSVPETLGSMIRSA